MNELDWMAISLMLVTAFGVPAAFCFGRALGREDELTKLPELRPGAKVRFQPRNGFVTRFVVHEYRSEAGGPTAVALLDEVSATMEEMKR